jgi:hypothetical protein
MTLDSWLWIANFAVLAVVVAQNMAIKERMRYLQARLDWITEALQAERRCPLPGESRRYP